MLLCSYVVSLSLFALRNLFAYLNMSWRVFSCCSYVILMLVCSYVVCSFFLYMFFIWFCRAVFFVVNIYKFSRNFYLFFYAIEETGWILLLLAFIKQPKILNCKLSAVCESGLLNNSFYVNSSLRMTTCYERIRDTHFICKVKPINPIRPGLFGSNHPT